MSINIAHLLNQPISMASVAHAELKEVFDKFRKNVRKFAVTGIINMVEDKSPDYPKMIISFVDREYEIEFTSYFENNRFIGRVSARRNFANSPEIGFITFPSRKVFVTDPLTKAEGYLTEAHFCRILLYGWLLKDIGWDINQLYAADINQQLQEEAIQEEKEEKTQSQPEKNATGTAEEPKKHKKSAAHSSEAA